MTSQYVTAYHELNEKGSSYYDSHKHRSINEHQEEVLSESGGATRSVLTVPGIPINNNINVQCVLLSFMITQKLLYSGLAFLRIQGNDQNPVILAKFYSTLSSTNKQEH